MTGNGGLDPGLGIDLTYFTDKTGFSRPMIAIDGPGVKWLTGIMTVPDENGKERLVARYDRRKGLGERYEQGLMVYDDQKEVFEKAVALKKDAALYADGVPFRVKVGEENYYYFPAPFTVPLVRVKATLNNVLNPESYEGFVDGSWKAGARPKRPKSQIDFETGEAIEASGTVSWNAYRKRWIMIAWRVVDSTYYFEGDTPVGPWVYGRRIVKYDHYTFYNVAHHPFFDQEDGRVIYFEGTYTREFSDAPVATPVGLVVLKSVEAIPAGVPPLAEIKDKVATSVKRQKAETTAMERAKQLAADAKAGDFGAAAKKAGASAGETPRFSRAKPAERLPGDVMLAALQTSAGQLSEPVKAQQGYYVLKVLERVPPDMGGLQAERDKIQKEVLAQKQSLAWESWLAGARANAKIETHLPAAPRS